MYLIGILASFLLGGVMAMLIRAELFTPDKMFLSENQYNEFFTVHGAVMIFLFIIPGIPARWAISSCR
jgi:cytochrome c oxidase subunit I